MTAAPDLWARIEPLLARVERPARYIDSEWGARHAPEAGYRAALLYPDTYELGMANQAIAILYDILNRLPDTAAERVFVPAADMAAVMREAGVPLFTLESCTPVAGCDLLGITLPYEMVFTNVLEALDLAGIPLRSADRGDGDPLVVGGGPATYNPEPMADFFDAIVIGEGEELVGEIVASHREWRASGESRDALLRRLAQVPGVYVPSLYSPATADAPATPLPGSDAPATVTKRLLRSLSDSHTPTCPVVPFAEVVHDRASVEILRGCARGCRFCQAGMVYRPVRERNADEIVRDAMATLRCTGHEEISLTSLSTTDHSQIAEVLRRLTQALAGTGISISLPSLRVDAFGVEMARLVSSGKKAGLTFAPEAGTQRLRDVINKNVSEDELLATVRTAFAAGWRRVKLYFMLGLPTETDEDILGIAGLVKEVLRVARDETPPEQRGNLRVAVSVSTFVPKAHTPFQWEPQVALPELERRQRLLRDAMPRKGVDLSWHDAQTSLLEAVFARGGRELSAVIERAWRDGAVFDAWTEQFSYARWERAFAAEGLDPEALAATPLDPKASLPWDHISAGVAKRFLARERDRARSGAITPDCTFAECSACGVCTDLGASNVLAGDRRA